MIDSSPLIESGPVRVKKCRHGYMAYLTSDTIIGRSLDYYGEFSEGEVELFRQLVQPGWLVVEVGANLGAHTVVLATLAGPQGLVHAFEPQRVIFQLLCTNVTLNGLGNVWAHHAAAGRQNGAITVPRLDYTQPDNFGGLPLGGWAEGESVPLIALDALALPGCHMIKIDAEGMEGEVIAGAAQTIRRFQPALYVENDRPEKSAALIRQLFDLGYRLYWHLPPLFNPGNYYEKSDAIFVRPMPNGTMGRIVSLNMVGLPQSQAQTVTGLREITSPEDDWRAPAPANAAHAGTGSQDQQPS